ncbi:MAG: hypothetical protein ORN98_03565 [Alphaproteobacteria bacterium]|nr:hypothetical protein [Alphaproteobacteria bacterium]
MPVMDPKKLTALLAAKIDQAVQQQQIQARDREQALRYYRGELFGNEVDGRSQIVSRDVADAIDGMMPSLLRIFSSGSDVVRFVPRQAEEEALAKQVTQYVNYIWNNANPGFSTYYQWFKDALLFRLGVVKIWWDAAPRRITLAYAGLNRAELGLLLQDEGVQLLHWQSNDGNEGDGENLPDLGNSAELAGGFSSAEDTLRFDVKICQSDLKGRVAVVPVPPEEFLYDINAASIETADFVAHRMQMTTSDVIAQGFDEDLVRQLTKNNPNAAGSLSQNSEKLNRLGRTSHDHNVDSGQFDPASSLLWVTECYVHVDMDGDGLTEWHKITVASSAGVAGKKPGTQHGNGLVILADEEIEQLPFACLTPILMPHQCVGRSVADQVMDLQLIKSTLLRQMLDNLYLTNNPEKEVVEGLANVEDLLTSRPGGIKRVKQAGVIRTLETPFVAGATFPMLDYIDTARQQRTGLIAMNQGLDADTLNKTATGINLLANAGKERVELIARVFAETGVRQAFRRILELVSKHENQSQILKLNGQFVPINPQNWRSDWDMTIEVGIGTGTREAQIAQIGALMQVSQHIVAQQGGLNGPLVTWQNLFDQISKYVELMGLQAGDRYFSDPMPILAAQAAQAQRMAELQAANPSDLANPLQNPALAQQIAESQLRIHEARSKAMIDLEAHQAKAEFNLAVEKAKSGQPS